MATLDLAQLHSRLEKTPLDSIYLIIGEEAFMVDDAIDRIRGRVLSKELEDFNLDIFYGQAADLSQVRDTIETLPLMAEKRLVLIKEAQDIKDKDLESLFPIIDNPVSSTVLVLSTKKIDQRKKIYKKCEQNGCVVKLQRPYENQIPSWIQYLAKRNRTAMTPDAIQLLQQLVGTHLIDLDNEIKKLSQYVGDERTINIDDVLHVVSKVRIDSVFDFTNAIGNNDKIRALLSLSNLIENGQNAVGILTLVARHLRVLMAVQDGLKEGLAGARLGTKVGISQFFIRQYIEQSRGWTMRKLEKTYEMLLETDRALKSSPISSHIWLENFVIKTCSYNSNNSKNLDA
jgi:DNA polymerase-3 subunit delta